MCGIAGIIGNNAADYANHLRRMIAAESHRGPDGDGVWISHSRHCVLGHRRLSILDLSTAAAQPMLTHDASCALSYNGELYNFQLFREELERAGIHIKSSGDTEVLAELLRRRGAAVLPELNGMFGLAFWKEDDQSLLLARDQFGQKPVYYAEANGLFLFASEVRALLASGLIEREVDPQAVESFLAYGAVQSPLTIVKGVHLLPSGCSLLRKGSQSTVERYWQFPRAKKELGPEELREDFRSAVERHLVSDAPIGLFLSGGIDSSAIAAAAVRSRTEPVISLSVIFPEEPAHSEEKFARLMADFAGTEHRAIPITGQQIGPLVRECLASMDQPTIDSINTYVVAYAAREAGLKVALSGLGGDELFAGYPVFADLPRLLRLHRMTGPLRSPAARMLGVAGGSRKREKLVDVLESRAALVDLHLARRRILSARQIRQLASFTLSGNRAFVAPDEFTRLEESSTARELPDAVGVLEMQTFMEQMLLRDSDVMGMANHLEIRVPFLDAEFAAASLRLPASARVPSDPPKKAFIDAMGDWLPREVTHRPKQGFTFPFVRWVQRELSRDVETGLRRLAEESRVVKSEPTQELWSRFRRNPSSVGWSRPWALFVLSEYLARHELRMPQQ